MTPLPTIANVWRLALNWELGDGSNQTAENVIHVRVTGGTPPDPATAVDAALTSNMFAPCSTSAIVYSITETPLDGSSASSTRIVTNPNAHGGTSGAIAPAFAAVVSLATAERGRSKRGRVFVPMVGLSAITDGSLTSTPAGLMRTAWTTFIAALATAEVPLVVASYKLASATDVISASIKAQGGTQRRRQTRVRYP
jgi:hypothetical protein